VSVELFGTKVSGNVSGNVGVDFQALGARTEPNGGSVGTDNHVKIELHGVSKKLEVLTAPGPNNTNTVTVNQ
jgi:hypothetical protein